MAYNFTPPTLAKQALAVLRAAWEPRDPDHFAGPGLGDQEPDLLAELHAPPARD